jgi:DNA polymerase delta subunit 1
METFETGVPAAVKLFHSRGLPSVGWVRVTGARPVVAADARVTTCDDEFVVMSARNVEPAQAPADCKLPPVVVASWDLEVFSESRKFPVATNDEDAIIQISTAFSPLGDPSSIDKTVLCLGETAPVEGVEIRCFETEEEMLLAWVHLLRDRRADLLIGYNTDGFDWAYILGRQMILLDARGDELVDLSGLGRLREGGGKRVEKDLSSAAFGQNKFTSAATPGVLQLDLLTYMRREFKLESYSLNSVAAKFLGDSKLDLPAHRIFDLYESGGPEGRAEIAAYAAKDTLLPTQLLEKLRIFVNVSELANATNIPFEFIVTRGQQIRVFSCIVRTARRMGFAVPDNRAITPPEGVKYEGATVLDPLTGAHTEPVCTLDFASLYPSIIRAQGYCWSTLVLDQEPPADVVVDSLETPLGTYRWVQGCKGVLPSLLEELAALRKAAKRDMAAARAAGDSFLEALMDARQLAIKVVMNSAYGFCGSRYVCGAGPAGVARSEL